MRNHLKMARKTERRKIMDKIENNNTNKKYMKILEKTEFD